MKQVIRCLFDQHAMRLDMIKTDHGSSASRLETMKIP